MEAVVSTQSTGREEPTNKRNNRPGSGVMIWYLLYFIVGVFSQRFLISFHQDINNLYSYSLQGDSPTPFFQQSTGDLNNLRGMIQIAPTTLIVANAKGEGDGDIVITTDCGQTHSVLASGSNFAHPYGIAFNFTGGTFYTTQQNTDSVLSFKLRDPSNVRTFASVGTPRGLAVDPVSGYVHVASEAEQAILVFDTSGNQVFSLTLSFTPIGVLISGRTLYVSSKENGAVSFNIGAGYTKVNTYQAPNMGHGCGMVVSQGNLYLLGMKEQVLGVFQESDGKFLQTLIPSFDDDPEQVILTTC
eukprot:TRINITY_DN6533_c0_g1_i5.p1 TRINITY_DN6533_c0_g1~~TRINITY_DN6533_c0_g1_i5.p1  ORF type:complete len:301 (-),score=53.40 TRINITY_DN6533_c0_g1_i5:1042-1944(-)